MDEAERCHRVALMHAGKLLALDTIPRLKTVFASGSVLEVECRDAARALEHLEDLPGVLDAALFGSHLHAVVAQPEVAQAIERHLQSGSFAPVTVRPVEPSLEDVFIRSIRDAEERRRPVIRRVLATAVKELLQLKRDWRTASPCSRCRWSS